METGSTSSSKVVVRWSEEVAGRYGAASLVLAAISVVAWLLMAAGAGAGAHGGALLLGAAFLAGAFSAATFVVARVGSMLGRTIESIDRDAATRGPAPA